MNDKKLKAGDKLKALVDGKRVVEIEVTEEHIQELEQIKRKIGMTPKIEKLLEGVRC